MGNNLNHEKNQGQNEAENNYDLSNNIRNDIDIGPVGTHDDTQND